MADYDEQYSVTRGYSRIVSDSRKRFQYTQWTV